MLARNPLIAIVGATGTGKSQLAISLAQRLNGEIINGDAMQMYDGLPIITNKIPVGERKDVPHHLMGCIKLDEDPWTVRRFVDRASCVIEEIRSRNKVPILVGGTHYYTQSLLFRNATVDHETEYLTEAEQEQRWPILSADTRDMLEELRKVDPMMAGRWHPNDRRKIRRSLEVYLTTGEKASDIYERQQQSRAGKISDDSIKGFDEIARSLSATEELPLRYETLVLWTYACSSNLNLRLDDRVDNMILQGLLGEVKYMHTYLQSHKQQGDRPDESRGIWIAIGLKELIPYIVDEGISDAVGPESIERTKIATRQYAKRQHRWIKLKLQRALAAAGSSNRFFLLDGSNLAQWPQLVEAKALELAISFLSGSNLPQPASLSIAATENLVPTQEVKQSARQCEACNKTLMSEEQWMLHLRSKGHRSAIKPKIDWAKQYPKGNST